MQGKGKGNVMSDGMMTDNFAKFVAPAREQAAIWRLALGALIVVLTWIALSTAMSVAIGAIVPPSRINALLDEMTGGSTPVGMAFLFATFAGPLLGVWLAVRIVHRRSFVSILGGVGPLWAWFKPALVIAAALYGVYVLAWIVVFDSLPNLTAERWLRLLPLGLAGLAVQTLAEEVLFRGYLVQQLAARFRSPIIWMPLPALCFGLLHLDPRQPAAINIGVIGATSLFGLVATDLTRRTGSLGAAWALHMVNNTVAVLIIATQGSLTGLALRLTPYGADDQPLMTVLLGLDALMLLFTWFALARLLRR